MIRKRKKEVKINPHYLLIIMFLFFFFLISHEYLSAKLCENMRKEKFEDYLDGKVVVNFDGIGKEEAKKVIEEYDLKYEVNKKWTNLLIVNVPDGEELKWACRLEQNNKIRSGELIIK